jgi:glutamate/tyrosine decarboxylase-like PLP-dependent enzyme
MSTRRQEQFARLLGEYRAQQDRTKLPHLEGPGTNSLAAWFLGPKAENRELFQELVALAVDRHCGDRERLYPDDPRYVTPERMDDEYDRSVRAMRSHYLELLDNLEGSVPFFSHRYQAHMNWDLTMAGMLGYLSAMLYNQNNVALEASPITSHLEALVGDDLCRMLGFTVPSRSAPPGGVRPWGHITCDGSVANLEAMWACRNLKYYPLSAVAALENDERLASARAITVPVPEGGWEQLVSLDRWMLLNLDVDVTLSLATRIEGEYKIPAETVSSAFEPYLLQSLGFGEFIERYAGGFPPGIVIGPSTKHYSWPKNAALVGIGKDHYVDVTVDLDARMAVDHLREKLDQCLADRRPVLMVVAVLGSTEESAVDPLAAIVELRKTYRKKGLEFPIHVDAAWGGYFASLLRDPTPALQTEENRALQRTPALQLSEYVKAQYEAVASADSVTIDPHKAGYVPYPAGGLCYRNSAMRNLVAFLAPEVYHSDEPDACMGVFGVEGSKPGAAVSAVYLSHRVVRPDKSGYGKILGQALFNSKRFYAGIVTMARRGDPFVVVPVQRLPAEKDERGRGAVERQLKHIREWIVERENNEILDDPKAMALLTQLGSDQIIITYALNFEDAHGKLNVDPGKANDFNHEIFERLSLTPDPEATKKIPVIITTSEFEPEVYGDEFVRTFMKRLGVEHQELMTMNFLSSTTMSPWLTATERGNFIPDLIAGFRKTVLEIVEEIQAP